MIEAAIDAEDQFGNIEVVFIGDDDHGKFVSNHVDISVCQVTADLDGKNRIVFALVVDTDLEAQRTFVQ